MKKIKKKKELNIETHVETKWFMSLTMHSKIKIKSKKKMVVQIPITLKNALSIYWMILLW